MYTDKPDGATGAIDEEPDVFLSVLSIEEEELTDDGIRREVIQAAAKEHDPLLKKEAHDIGLGDEALGRRWRSLACENG
jgi:hypothetical protein